MLTPTRMIITKFLRRCGVRVLGSRAPTSPNLNWRSAIIFSAVVWSVSCFRRGAAARGYQLGKVRTLFFYLCLSKASRPLQGALTSSIPMRGTYVSSKPKILPTHSTSKTSNKATLLSVTTYGSLSSHEEIEYRRHSRLHSSNASQAYKAYNMPHYRTEYLQVVAVQCLPGNIQNKP